MRSLFTKLFLAHLLTLATALVIFGLLLSNAFQSLYERLAQQAMLARAKEMAAALAPAVAAGKSEEDLRDLVTLIEKSTHTQICLVLPGTASNVLGTGPGGKPGGKAGPGSEQAQPGRARMLSGNTTLACGESMVTASAALPNGQGVLQVRAPYSAVVEVYVAQLRKLVAFAGLVAVVVSALVALLLSERISVPLHSMRVLAARMAGGDFTQRLGLRRRDEIGALGGSFDSLADSLQQTLGELRREQARLRGILASVAEGIIAVDAEGRVTLINPQAADLLRLPAIALGGGGDVSQLESLGLSEEIRERFSECLRENRLCSAQLELAEPKRFLTLQVAPVQSAQAERWGAVAVLRDVTESRRLEQMRSRFISDASHEIRTPLTAIGGFAAAIADGTADTEEERTRCAAMIVREVERLNRLTNDLLDLSRIESGAVKLNLQSVDMAELIREAVASLETQIRGRGVLVELDLPGNLPTVRGDGDRLHQVLLNLLSNAIRFNSPQGKIAVLARSGDGGVRVEVRDTGVGIAPEALPHIWERFHRADPSRAREEGGTGLGLAIVRSIIAAHGGAVSVESSLGEGSVFSFTVPTG